MPIPDIAAPCVNVLSAKSGGGFDAFTGTSFAAPFVTGSAALMMQWGIADGNSPFFYGERIRAFLRHPESKIFIFLSGRISPTVFRLN